MAKVTGPMFSVSKSGTIGEAINFLKWKGSPFPVEINRATIAIVRTRAFPLIPKSPDVLAIRLTLATGVSTWHDDSIINAESKNSWIYYSSGLAMNGFNRYVQKFIDNNPQREPPWNIPSPE